MKKPQIRITYYVLTGLFWFSTAMISALYVLFLIEKGMNLAHVGIWAGVNTITVILMEVPTGGLADAWGRGRTYSLANIVISISILIMAFVPGLPSLYIGAALFGTGRALSSGSIEAWFIDALRAADPETDIEKETGAAGAVVLGGLAAGSLIGSLLPGLSDAFHLPDGVSPLTIPLAADASMKMILAVLSVILIREPNRHGSPLKALKESLAMAPGIARTAIQTIRTQRVVPWLFIAGAALALGIGSVESFWQPRFLELAPDEAGRVAFGVVMASCFTAGALMSLVAPLLTRLLGGKRQLSGFTLTLVTAAALIALSGSSSRGTTAFWMILVYGLIEGAAVPRKAMLNDVLPPGVRATMLSVDSMITYVGFAGTIGLGFLAESRGIPIAWRISGIGVATLSLSYLPILIRNRQRGGLA
jgi:DHA1 family quinolone resistance protein-like MFS transporter